jgi:hypothetical protein
MDNDLGQSLASPFAAGCREIIFTFFKLQNQLTDPPFVLPAESCL